MQKFSHVPLMNSLKVHIANNDCRSGRSAWAEDLQRLAFQGAYNIPPIYKSNFNTNNIFT